MSVAEDAQRLFGDAWAAQEVGDLERANNLIDKVVRLRQDSSVYWATRALFRLKSGYLTAALDSATEATELRVDNYHAWTVLGRTYRALGQTVDAIGCFERSLALKRDHNVYTLLAAAQLDLDPSAAAESARRALVLSPGWAEAQRLLAEATRLEVDSEASAPGEL